MTDEKMSSAQPENGFNIKRFIEEVIAEMKKVTWSSKKELISYTCVVAIAVAIVCSLIWVCDTIFARLFHIILR